MDPAVTTPRTRRVRILPLLWICSTLVGFPVAFVCLSHIAADSHRWDAVVPLNLAQTSNWAEDNLRSLQGGRFRVWISTVGFDQANESRLFAGRVDVIVRDPTGSDRFTGEVGEGGAALAKTTNSNWAEVGELEIPAAVFKPWTLFARVVAADENFRALQAEVILRKVRPDLGMGGLVFYVLIFPATALVLLSAFLSIVLYTRGRRWPAAVTFLASLPLWPLVL